MMENGNEKLNYVGTKTLQFAENIIVDIIVDKC